MTPVQLVKMLLLIFGIMLVHRVVAVHSTEIDLKDLTTTYPDSPIKPAPISMSNSRDVSSRAHLIAKSLPVTPVPQETAVHDYDSSFSSRSTAAYATGGPLSDDPFPIVCPSTITCGPFSSASTSVPEDSTAPGQDGSSTTLTLLTQTKTLTVYGATGYTSWPASDSGTSTTIGVHTNSTSSSAVTVTTEITYVTASVSTESTAKVVPTSTTLASTISQGSGQALGDSVLLASSSKLVKALYMIVWTVIAFGPR